MANYGDKITRPDIAAQQAEVLIRNAIFDALPSTSVVLGVGATRVNVPTGAAKFPVLSALPQAYWLTADDSLKQTTKAAWANKNIVISELAALVPVPDAVAEDAGFDIFGAMKPLLTQAAGKLVDMGVLFGDGLPPEQAANIGGDGIVAAATAAGNIVAAPVAPNPATPYHDLVKLGQVVAADGYNVTAWAGDSLLEWGLMGVVDPQGRPIFQANVQAGGVSSVLARPFIWVNNGAWDSAVAAVIGGDWSRLVVGIRRDITFELFTEGVISDAAGVVVYNLMQQDAKVLRMTMRLGFAVANPITPRASDGYPFGAITGNFVDPLTAEPAKPAEPAPKQPATATHHRGA